MDTDARSASDAMRMMLDSSGKSAYRISLDLGKSRNYVINALGRDPLVSTFVEVADATGHAVAILDAKTGDVLTKVQAPRAKVQETNQEANQET